MFKQRLILIIFALWASVGHAQSEQLSFIGVTAPKGSISKVGAASDAVYLRWDVVEGDLPLSWVSFRVERDGVSITPDPLPAVGHMPGEKVAALYGAPEHDRRRLEMARWLDEMGELGAVNPGNVGTIIAEQLAADPFWSMAASRIDMNVARARYRAWVDTPPAGIHTYSLWVETLTGAVELARVKVNTLQSDIALAPVGFRALDASEMARCDAPENARAHGVVALTWDSPTDTPADTFRYTTQVAGYDVFRSAAPTDVVDDVDLRALAALSMHDNGGRVALPGLVKVNDQPIQTAGTPERELGYDGWAPTWHHHMETADALAAAGVHPGETYAYYVVPRDFTGNYGDTAGTLVTVPDRSTPPTPWGIRAMPRPAVVHGEDHVVVRFPAMTVANFVADFGDDHAICNLDSAAANERILFASDGVCDHDAALAEYNLRISDYLVYRFASRKDAAEFQDSDGDGVADHDERQGNLADPSLACDSALHPEGAESFLVQSIPANDTILLADRQVIELSDPHPGTTPNKVYWYRVAARTMAGTVGPLSAPVRGKMPDYRGPERSPNGGTPYLGECGRQVLFSASAGHTAFDATGTAAVTQLSCVPLNSEPVVRLLRMESVGTNAATGALDDGSHCAALSACVGQSIRIAYFDEDGHRLADNETGTWNGECSLLRTVLETDCDKLDPIETGQVPTGDVYLAIPGYDGADCVNLYREVNGTRYRQDTICDGDFPRLIPTDATLGATTLCLSVAFTDDNGRTGPTTELSCIRTGSTRPEPPQPIGWDFSAGGVEATVEWAMPPQGGIGVIAEWHLADGSERRQDFLPADSVHVSEFGFVANVEVGAPPAGGDTQRWCFRGRTVVSQNGAPEDSLSEWSPTVCGIRTGAGALTPEYLPWPATPRPHQTTPRSAQYLHTDGVPVIDLGTVQPDYSCVPTIPPCDAEQGECLQTTQEIVPDFEPTSDGKPKPVCNPCDTLRAQIDGAFGFVVYRQERAHDGAVPSAFHQVSPVVDRLACEQVVDDQNNVSYVLSDPFINLVHLHTEDEGTRLKLLYTDRFPHTEGQDYRYEMVWFDAQGGIAQFARTNWVAATEAN